jgi:Tol biopolymer transport system component
MHGNNENHDIAVVNDVTRPAVTVRAVTAWEYDDIRPVWSPDGKKIAFYSNYNPQDDPRIWSIMVVAADGSDPVAGDGLAVKAVAVDVVPDVERGPAWMPDSSRIVYVKNDRQEYHPIYVVTINDKASKLLRTDTKMNHDVACSPDGTIAFRAQVNQWDQIFVAKIKE